ncbi:uncharacterized protein F4822DRAFT_270000 [Hypoxylon trugodes]|uniref:uncharacterized protein n=1 Tax=Hypoxylon trugodes TaxID=326681 RepID=UPI0021904129|nr:uncharacterized protein F4822DRAFT_270000 [Hypoxylon trugodes]KAI1389112.1 hypothetical protein F4822DRAFT_270000 [Hypoxylon trugodes]
MDTYQDDLDEYGVSIREDRRQKEIRGDDLNSGNIEPRNATACVNTCFDSFVNDWSKSVNGGFEDVCNYMSNVQHNTDLWKLYCCDETSCGVWIDGGKGQSPSVDKLINKCSNAGNYLIYDPGAPSPDTCTVGFSIVGIFTATTTAKSSPSSSAVGTSRHNSTLSGVTAAPSALMGLTEGSKAAIGICSGLAIIAILFLVGFMICRKRPHPKDYSDRTLSGSRLGRSSSEPPSGSRTPLISPPSASSKGPPLTPPARLSDRRFLPSLLKQGGTPNSSVAYGMEGVTFLDSPLSPSAEKKSAVRHDEWPTTDTVTKPPTSPSHPAAVHFAPYFLRDSGSSYSSGPGGASTTTVGSNKPGSLHSRSATITGTSTPPLLLPLSPSRPQRPHDGPLEIPNLVTPAGPPPNRALPAPPPYHPTSPTFSVSPVSPPSSPIFPLSRQLTVPNDNNHIDTKGPPEPSPIDLEGSLPASTKDLRDLTESYARETSESWGSWGGAGGGGPGVSINGGKKRGHRGNRGSSGEKKDKDRDRDREKGSTASLPKLDLEKLGGKY